MHTGHYISALGHGLVIGCVLFGGIFRPAPPEFEVSGVSVISVQEFAALEASQLPPAPVTDISVPVAPVLSEDAPGVQPVLDTPVEKPEPESAESIDPDTPPDLTETTPPDPAPVVEDVVTFDQHSTEAAPQEASRVAPEPVAQPGPDVEVAEELQEAVDPDQSAETSAEPVQETAPEAATTEIVTEATETTSAAPARSVRPQVRSRRPQPEPSKTQENVNAALAEALAETPARLSGPPLSRGEKDSLRVAVSNCWNVDVGGLSANVTVTLAMSMNRDGTVDIGSIEMIAAEGGSGNAVRTAFDAARRAITRCQRGGYPLPVEKYDHWRNIEMTFNPSSMRIR